MSITVESTTDTPEAVVAATGNVTQPEVKPEETPAPVDQETEPDETQSESETENEEPQEDEAPKKKGGFQKRIDKLSRRLSERDQEIEYWKKQALEKAPADQAKPAESKPVVDLPDGRPDPAKFEDQASYIDAVADWKLEQKLKERDAQAKQQQMKDKHQSDVAAFQTKVAAVRQQYNDFDDVMEEADDIPLSVTVHEVLLASDVGAEMMYELAKDKENLRRICAMPAIQAARELGKFEAKLTKEEPQPEKQKQTSAPKPISPVGKASGGVTKDPDKMTYQEYKRWRESNK